MSLFSGFSLTPAEVSVLSQAAVAASAGASVPSGWNVRTPQQLGVPSQFWDGPYFTNNGASAIVLQQGSSWIVSFRGTDGPEDVVRFPQLVLGTYINNFQPLLNAIATNAPPGTNFYFTGRSLGGGATNQMADIASSQYGGKFAGAEFVAFASPILTNANGILNIGFENDPVYKVLNGYSDFGSSLDNLVLATSEYMAGNYDGRHPENDYAHNSSIGFEAFGRLLNSSFIDEMSPDSVIILDAFSGTVQDITPGRENVGAFYIGQNVADTILGRNGPDFLEGFGGDDVLNGGVGNDVVGGGAGADVLTGGPGLDTFILDSTSLADAGFGIIDRILDFGANGDRLDVRGLVLADEPLESLFRVVQIPSDSFAVLQLNRNSVWTSLARLEGIQMGHTVTLQSAGQLVGLNVSASTGGSGDVPGLILFGGPADDLIEGASGSDALFGDGGDDRLVGRAGADRLEGGNGHDALLGEDGDDQLLGGDGNDQMIGGAGLDLVLGGTGDDRLEGNDGNDRLEGEDGFDTLVGGDGIDLLLGQGGNDQIYGEAGGDRLEGAAGIDALAGGAGDDQMIGGTEGDYLFGGDGLDQLLGEDGDDLLSGEGGADRVDGGAGNDQIYGGDSDDIMIGGAGNDDMNGGAGHDLFVFSGAFGQDRIFSFAPGTGPEDRIQLTGLGFTSFSDVLANTTTGAAGAVINASGNTITLFGVTVASLSADDFLI